MIVLLAFAGSAKATIITGNGYIFENFEGYTSQNLFGWYSPGNGTGTLTNAPTANVSAQNGQCFPRVPGDCSYLEVKDTGTQGMFVSAGTAWGTSTTPVSYMSWDGGQLHYYVADIKSGGGTPAIATTFGTIYLTGNHVRTSASCTTGCTFGTTTVYSNTNNGIITQKGVWYELGTVFTETSFRVLNATGTPSASDPFISRVQWLDLIAQTTNVSMDTSVQGNNSSDVIAIDDFGFNPEPATYLLMGGGLVGMAVALRRMKKK